MDTRILSQIKILACDKIRPYEWPGPQVDFIDLSDLPNTILHPFPVTEMENGDFILFEDSACYYSLVERGISYLPVQICQPKELKVDLLRQGLVNFTRDDLITLSSRHADQIIIAKDSDQSAPGQDYIPIEFDFIDSGKQMVYLRHSSRIGCPQPLAAIFRAIEQSGGYRPATDRRHYEQAVLASPTAISGYLSMAESGFSFDDFRSAAISDQLFPPGIARVMPARRVLGIDLALDVLSSESSIEEKEEFLKALIMLREQNSRTTYYEGSVYILNR